MRQGTVTFQADVYSLGRIMANVQYLLQTPPAANMVQELASHALAHLPKDRPTLQTIIDLMNFTALASYSQQALLCSLYSSSSTSMDKQISSKPVEASVSSYTNTSG